jgi:YVTN family beta-propeller protein
VIDGLDSLAGGARASRRRFTARTCPVWVTNQVAGTVSRIDPRTNKMVKTIQLGFSPTGSSAPTAPARVAAAREFI